MPKPEKLTPRQIERMEENTDEIRDILLTETEVVALNPAAHTALLVLGLEMLYSGTAVKAKIVKGYQD